MTTATQPTRVGKAKRAAAKAPLARLAFARAVEATVAGDAPESARLWRAGWNDTDKGALNFTADSARMCLADAAARGNPLAWYYEHEDRIPLEKRGGAPMRGVCSAPSSVLEARGPADAPECWATQIAWTDEARRQIVSGERRQLSPIAAYDEETREIVAILNVSLCAEGATHHGTLLASAGKDTGNGMDLDTLIQAICDAAAAMDWQKVEALAEQAEGMDGGEMAAKMARAFASAATDGGAGGDAGQPKPATDPPVVAKKMAAMTREQTPAGVNVEVFNRALADMQSATAEARAATKRSDRATVTVALSRARDEGLPVDGIDEREHLSASDPGATEKWLASLRRKAKAGIIVASKDDGAAPAAPPKPGTKPKGKGATVIDETYGLTPLEIQTAGQHGVSLEAYARSKDSVATSSRRTSQTGAA